MRRWVLGWVALFAVAGLLTASTVSSNAAGAPAAASKGGCTCHSASASTDTTVALGLPSAYEPGRDYEVTIGVAGPAAVPVAQNTGGFAVQVSAGLLVAGDGTKVSGLFITHTAQGNDQRSWKFHWVAPASGDVTFFAAANAVNGDTLANDLDHWNQVKVVVPASGSGASTTGPSSPRAGSPGLSVAPVAAAVLVLAVLLRRRA
jgi:hypothetical protein